MKLFSSFQVKNMTLRNRVVMPPMCMYSAENGMPNAFHFTHYTSRAVGGVGLIIIEATGVMPNGRISDHCLGLWNDEQMHALTPLVSECRRLGAKVAIQLNHAGRMSRSFLHRAPSRSMKTLKRRMKWTRATAKTL